jgi:hypothetical protein
VIQVSASLLHVMHSLLFGTYLIEVIATACQSSRGGVFDTASSSTWEAYEYAQVTVDVNLGYNEEYAEYGLDVLEYGSEGTKMANSLIGNYQSSTYWLGFLGLGITPVTFNQTPALGPIGDLYAGGYIPSRSYGYTAGAKYRLKGTPNSLTLGGYDSTRLELHNTTFHLNPSQEPVTYLSDIVVSTSQSTIPSNWTKNPMNLFDTSSAGYYTIDSTTSFLWLPKATCDKFADALGLSYNDTLNLYTFDSLPSQHEALQDLDLEFTFLFKDTSDSTQVVNITLPYAAFDLSLSYPFIPDTSSGSPDASKYYFPLRRADNDTQYTIGRVLLQEAYIIANYDSNTFSLHQAVHPADPLNGAQIVDITGANTGSNGTTGSNGSIATTGSIEKSRNNRGNLSYGAVAGIVVGFVIGFIAILGLGIFLFLRRHRSQHTPVASSEKLGDDTIPESPFTSTPTSLRFARFFRRDAKAVPVSPVSTIHETVGSTSFPRELGAEANEIYELPAPLSPVELNGEGVPMLGSIVGAEDTSIDINLSEYERTHRSLEAAMALQSVPLAQTGAYLSEKDEEHGSTSRWYSTETRPRNIPSQSTAPVSPTTTSSSQQIPSTPPPTYSRLNAEPPNFVCIGELSYIRPPGLDDQTIRHSRSIGSSMPSSSVVLSGTDLSLGAMYPEIENQNSSHASGRAETDSEMLERGGSRGRIEGEELVHVPQLPERRFSWE